MTNLHATSKSNLTTFYFILFFTVTLFLVTAALFEFQLVIEPYSFKFLLATSIIVVMYRLYSMDLLVRYINKHLLMYLTLIATLFFCLIFYSFFLEEKFDSAGRSSVDFITSFTVGIICWILAGSAFYLSVSDLNDSKLIGFLKRNALIILIIVLSLFLISNGGFHVYRAVHKGSDNLVSHLFFGSLLIYTIIFFQAYSNKHNFFGIFILNLILLFIIGGRSDFFIFILTIIIYIMFFNKNTTKLLYFLFFVPATLLVFVLLMSTSYWSNISIDTSSYTNALTGDDSSKQARDMLLESNIRDLKNKLFIGNPNYFIDAYNYLGYYIHNIISIWEFYGLPMFLYIIYILIKFFRILMTNKIAFIETDRGRFLCLMFIFTGLSILLSKSVTYYPFWFTLGYFFFYVIFETKNTQHYT